MFLKTLTKTPEKDYPQSGENGEYWVNMGKTSLTLEAVHKYFITFIDPTTVETKHDDGNSYVITGKLPGNKVPVTLRTRGKHGPTIEFNQRYPQPWKNGIIEKYRIGGKLILIRQISNYQHRQDEKQNKTNKDTNQRAEIAETPQTLIPRQVEKSRRFFEFRYKECHVKCTGQKKSAVSFRHWFYQCRDITIATIFCWLTELGK